MYLVIKFRKLFFEIGVGMVGICGEEGVGSCVGGVYESEVYFE